MEYFKESANIRHEFRLRANNALAPSKRLMAFLEDVIPEEHNYDISASIDDFMRSLVSELSNK